MLRADIDNVEGISNRLPKSSRYKYVGIPIIQLDLNGNYIKTWKNAADIKKALGFSEINIHGCCKRKQKTASGFKWMFKGDYDKLVKDKI